MLVPGDRAHAADRRPLHRALRRDRGGAALAHDAPPSATRSGAGCARARRGSASGRARPCSPPSASLGLIVVDEEHDSSYKHEGDPRYDARDVAAERASPSGRPAAAGKRHAAAGERPADARSASSPRRVDGRPLPPVEVLDMRGQRTGLHPETASALAEVRARGGKAIVLLNRRGWSNFLSCRSCGRVWSCPECDVALVLHRAGGYLACHHCGHREPTPVVLPGLRLAGRRPPRSRDRAPRPRARRRLRRRRLPRLPPRRRCPGGRRRWRARARS